MMYVVVCSTTDISAEILSYISFYISEECRKEQGNKRVQLLPP
jgi:hypothetical protein